MTSKFLNAVLALQMQTEGMFNQEIADHKKKLLK